MKRAGAARPWPPVWSRYGSLQSIRKNYLVPLRSCYRPAGGPSGVAAQLVGLLLI